MAAPPLLRGHRGTAAQATFSPLVRPSAWFFPRLASLHPVSACPCRPVWKAPQGGAWKEQEGSLVGRRRRKKRRLRRDREGTGEGDTAAEVWELEC